jgi:hypothetical protein
MPQGVATEGDEEIRLVELAELNTEGGVLDQKRIAAAGTVSSEQELLAAEAERFGATELAEAQCFLLGRQTFVVESAFQLRREVIRALDGVVAGEKASKLHRLTSSNLLR